MRDATKKIWVSVLNQAYIHTNLVEILMFLDRTSPYELHFEFPSDKPGVHNRSRITQRFLESDFDYLMMIDSGVIPPMNVLNLVSYDVPIISPWIAAFQSHGIIPLVLKEVKLEDKKDEEKFLSRAMGIPVIKKEKSQAYGILGEKDGEEIYEGLVEVDATGTGCILIKRQVLEDLKPAFWDVFDPDTGERIIGQDLNFCKRAREIGYKTYVHMGYEASHVVPMDMTRIYNEMAKTKNELVPIKKR